MDKNNRKLPENLAAKHRARKRIVQALYQIQFNHSEASKVIEQFMDEQDFRKVDAEFFEKTLTDIEKNKTQLGNLIEPYLDREKSNLGAVEYAILLLASHELLNCIETPFKVVINEAILMAQSFGGEGSHTFINGVLYQVARKTRSLEMGENS